MSSVSCLGRPADLGLDSAPKRYEDTVLVIEGSIMECMKRDQQPKLWLDERTKLDEAGNTIKQKQKKHQRA